MTSYWRSTLGRPALTSDVLPAEAHVVVIGAGVVGASTAYWLARAGMQPLLIEQSSAAAGASGANGGLLVSGLADSYSSACLRLGDVVARRIYEYSLSGQQMMQSIIHDESIDCLLRVNGNLSFCLGERQAEVSRANIARLQRDGFPSTWLERDDLDEIVKQPMGADVRGARYNPAAATLHSTRLVNGLLDAARRAGARLTFDCAAQQIEPARGGWLISTPLGSVQAERVIVVVNAWSDQLLPQLSGKIRMVRGQVLTTAPTAQFISAGFGVALTETGEYGQQLPDGRILFGGCRALAVGRDVGAPIGEVSDDVQNGLEEGLARIFPKLHRHAVEQRWSGPMAFTDDYVPIVDQAGDGLFFAGGFSGHGMPFAANVGRHLSDACAAGRLPAALHDFRSDRPTLTTAG